MSIEQQMEDLEKKVEETVQRIEDALLGKSDKSDISNDKDGKKRHIRRSGGNFLGYLLVLTGLYLLGNHYNWFEIDLPMGPLMLILFGVWLLFDK